MGSKNDDVESNAYSNKKTLTHQEEVVLQHYYDHLRHIESARHWFTNSFLILIGAILTFVPKIGFDPYITCFAFIFLAAFSIVGLFISKKSGVMVGKYSDSIAAIINDLELEEEKNPFHDREPGDTPSISIAYDTFYLVSAFICLAVFFISLIIPYL